MAALKIARRNMSDEGGVLKAFRTPADLLAAAAEVVKCVPPGEHLAICGGLAMGLYGSDRMTTDLDLLADSTLGLLATRALSFGGIRTDVGGIPTDIIVRSDRMKRLYEDALLYARVYRSGLGVVGPEFLAVMKVQAHRPKDEYDVKHLIKARKLNVAKTRRLVDRYLGEGGVIIFDDLRDDAARERTREKRESK